MTWLDNGIEITLCSSKVDQAGAGFVKFIPLAYGDRCPVKALKHWHVRIPRQPGQIYSLTPLTMPTRLLNRRSQGGLVIARTVTKEAFKFTAKLRKAGVTDLVRGRARIMLAL